MGRGEIGKLNKLPIEEKDKAFVQQTLGVLLQIKQLGAERCTTPQELDDRLQKVVELCLQARNYSNR